MTSIVNMYRLTDFEKIKNDGITYKLSQETIDIIKNISSNVGAPEYVKTPHFEKKINGGGGYRQKQSNVKETIIDDWSMIRNFKTTVLEKKKGIELSVDKIRKSLNKITDKTYDKMLTQIIDEIEIIVNDNKTDDDKVQLDEFIEELNRIGDSIFDIASGNSFYSKIYAKLYKELINKYKFMNDIFNKKIKNNNYLFEDYSYCSPDSNYDEFCKNNKLNEKRRALGLFYINLMLEGILSPDIIITIIEEIQENLLIKVKQSDNSNIVEEMSEFLYIVITNGITILKKNNGWEQIMNRVNIISSKKHKSEPSITNKSIFKHLDIQNVVNKK